MGADVVFQVLLPSELLNAEHLSLHKVEHYHSSLTTCLVTLLVELSTSQHLSEVYNKVSRKCFCFVLSFRYYETLSFGKLKAYLIVKSKKKKFASTFKKSIKGTIAWKYILFYFFLSLIINKFKSMTILQFWQRDSF